MIYVLKILEKKIGILKVVDVCMVQKLARSDIFMWFPLLFPFRPRDRYNY